MKISHNEMIEYLEMFFNTYKGYKVFKNPFGIFIRFSDNIEFRLYLIGKCYLKVGKLMYYASNKFKIMKYLMKVI